MKLHSIIASLFILTSPLTAFATPNKTHKAKTAAKSEHVEHSSAGHKAAHLNAHRSQLANAKTSRIDRSVINNLLIEDIRKREEKQNISSESNAMLEDLLTEARTHLGKRYRHGAKGPSAFDCSGFSSYVYAQFGYKISPSSRQQFTEGMPVKRNELRKGDLVFFTSRRSGNNVGHVGIVVSANNETGDFKFIHASTSSGIKIDDCKGYYAGRYLGAKRIIND